MCRPLLVRLDAYGVPTGTTCAQDGGIIRANDERVAIRVGEVFGLRCGLANVVSVGQRVSVQKNSVNTNKMILLTLGHGWDQRWPDARTQREMMYQRCCRIRNKSRRRQSRQERV